MRGPRNATRARYWQIGVPLVCWACAHGAIDDTQAEMWEQEASASTDAATGTRDPDAAETSTAIDSGDEQGVAADVQGADVQGADVQSADVQGVDGDSADAGVSVSDASGADDLAPGCVTGGCTAARRAFVSEETYDGALGGHAGADATCQKLATGAGLGGTWMAWISDSSSSPSQRFSKSTVGYSLLDGTSIAANWTDLTTRGTTHAIDVTESGSSLASVSSNASKTWTATLVSGDLGTPSCGDFGSNASTQTGVVGHCTGTGTVNWTSAFATEACNVQNHLYCFEQ